MLNSRLKIALIQLAVSADKAANLLRAKSLVKKAASQGAQLVILPECFNSPYGTQYFAEYAEKIPGESTDMLSEVAKEAGVHLVGGSIPESRDGHLYNTSTAYNSSGKMIMKFSKMHLFDIDIPGKIRFQESEVLSPGEGYGMFNLTSSVKVGLGICYDIRFSELGIVLAREGCKLLVYPGAFNMTTGPAHWELLQRARAIDNQLYVATCSPARDESATYTAWGHSTVINPWGEVVAKASEKEEIVFCELDFKYLEEVREQIPITKQRRDDLYELLKKK